MAVIQHRIWESVAADISLEWSKQYFDFQYFDTENPLDPITILPGLDEFFGTKVLNLFIVGLPYGWKKKSSAGPGESKWEFDWPPEGFEAAVARHKETYKLFASYKTYVWMDWVIVKKVMDAEPEAEFEDMMEATEDKIKEMCDTLSKFGFKFVKRLEEEVGSQYFRSYLKSLYKVDPT